jgi:MoaA/NifB/PqqE/SkfB family radical SAM enzyme
MRTHQLIAPEKKILRHPTLLAAMRYGARVNPVNVEMDLSDACNLKCQWCAFAYMRRPVVMGLSLATKILDELASAGVRAITFSGGGEPTMNPAFAEIVEYAAGLGLSLGLYTNGLLVGRVLPVLSYFSWVYVSLDAASRQAYRATKGVDAFEQVTGNVRQLVETKEDTILGLGFLLNGDNWRQVRHMASLRHTLGVDYVQFRPVVGLRDYRWVPMTLGMLDEFENEHVIVSRQRFLELLYKAEREYSLCRASELVPCVGADGTLWVCPNTRGLRSLGDLKERTFDELWQARPAQPVGDDCRAACRNHFLNQTLDYVCGDGPHDDFV